MKARKRNNAELLPTKVSDGRDELNLAEFPLCAIAGRLDPTQKTLVFEDRIFDRTRGGMIPRQLTITGSDAYGLPTAADDEVLLGLVQLSKLYQFADRKVPFTRYQLVQLLGWRDDGKSYERLEESLNRWTGVTLYYQNAWWNKTEQCWVNEKLHVLDNASLVKAPRPKPKATRKQAPVLSSFIWNEVVFQSFQAGNLKRLDFDFYLGLKSAVAKRLYRFLDKRFFQRRRWEFNVKELAWEHVGLSRSYDAANLKRKLRPAIIELEERNFLRPLVEGERFRKIRAGEWQVVFEKSQTGRRLGTNGTEPVAQPDPLLSALTARGVSSNVAAAMLKRHSSERIQAQLEIFDWLVTRKDPKLTRNPPGFLVASIQSDYEAPPEFHDARELRRGQQDTTAARQRRQKLQNQRAVAEEQKDQQRQRAIEQYWQSLTEPERRRREQAALAAAPLFQRKLLGQGGSLERTARQTILDAHALQAMATRN